MYQRDRCLDVIESSQVNKTDKTRFIWLGGQQQLLKVGIESVTLLGDTVIFQSSVNDLGAMIDGPLTMRDHVQKICHTSSYQLRQLRVIRGSLSIDACTMLVHAFVSSRLDYCNSLLGGITGQQASVCAALSGSPDFEKTKIQSHLGRYASTLTLAPVKQRIQYKLGLLVYKWSSMV